MELTHTVVSAKAGGSSVSIYQLLWGGYDTGNLLVSCTGNCQLNSYRFFKNLLENNIPFEEFKKKYTLLTKRPILLVDINANYLAMCKKWCGEERVISEMPYLSTNDSQMVIVLIKII